MNRRRFLGLTAAGGAALLVGDMLIEPQRLEVTRNLMRIGEFSRPAGTMVQISDLHLQRNGRHEENIVSATNEIRPDFIAITGDSIDHRAKLGVLDEFMSNLDASVPKVALVGNWEYWSGVDFNALEKLYSRY